MKTMIIALISMMTSMAFAKAYGDAGCGLGSQVFQNNNETISQVLAATTNGTSGNQTFGITSGTSNCTEGGHVRSAMQVPMFIEVNKLTLAKESARGQGETVAGLAQLMGCDAQSLGHAMQANYKQLFVDTSMQPAAIEAGINSMIQSNKATCGLNNVAAQ